MTADPAVHRARLVVGLYGDPGVTWSIVVRLALADRLEAGDATRRAATLHGQHAHLGRPPALELYAAEQRDGILGRLADEPFRDDGPLVRVALDEAGHELVVAVHHGCADGLGLLGYAAALTGHDLPSSARGLPAAAEPSGFARRSLGRLAEALVSPPLRLTDRRPSGDGGDLLLSRDVPPSAASTAALLLGAVRAIRCQLSEHGVPAGGRRPTVVAVGLSRRPGSPTPPPDRDTAYARVRTDSVMTIHDAQLLVERLTPEPAFPVTSAGGIGPRVTRLLSSRLGSTLLVSNLGRVDQPAVTRLEFWPVAAGPAGVSVGLASTPTTTTITTRLRRGWFSNAEGVELATRMADQLALVGREVRQ